ncbi:MAG: hypothetical protein EB828_06515 [Nitrosopumilus sp. D6]|nr:MAG: hypothetical protein EB828_06515 [Nitrosopumilus sp. D6]
MFLPASAAPLSDRTGLVNTLSIDAGGHPFEVRIVGNFDVTGHEFDGDKKRLLILVDSSLENNIGEIVLPIELLGGNLTLYLNGDILDAKVHSNDLISFLTLDFEGIGENRLEIFGSASIVSVSEIPIDNTWILGIIVVVIVIIIIVLVIVLKIWMAKK